MKIIIALGNPGTKYAQTRHNLGWIMADLFQKDLKNNITDHFQPEKRFQADVLRFSWHNEACILVKPQTFMNLSGESVEKLTQFYKIEPEEDLLLLHDDLDLPFGRVRARQKGRHGGHNGLRDIFTRLKTQNLPRVKLGIAKANPEDRKHVSTADFVLSRFLPNEKILFPEIYHQARPLIITFLDRAHGQHK